MSIKNKNYLPEFKICVICVITDMRKHSLTVFHHLKLSSLSFGNKFFSLRVINDSIIPGIIIPSVILYYRIPFAFSAFIVYGF